jgi:hypothetical protein
MIVTDERLPVLVCEVFSGGLGIEAADRAERLIASAPRLLRELRAAYRVLVNLPGQDSLLADIDAAIVQATGGQQ